MAIASMSVAGMAQLQSGIKMENLNQSVKAGDDFYEFACGGWMKNNPLPAAYARFGSFDQLGQDNNVRINNILKDLLTKEYAAGTNERKMSDYYKLAMDSARRNREGVKPVMPLIREMEAAKTKAALMKLMEKYAMKGFGRVYSAYFGADEKDSKNNILSINQSGLTLGQKDYYVADDPATTAIREAYKKHVVRMFRLFGFNQQQAQQKMQNIFRFETELAKVSKSRTELRDPAANYNKMTLNEAESRWPNLRIMQLLFSSGVQPEHVLKLVVGQPSFMDGADKLTANMTADALRAYMEWDVINSSTGYLSDEVSEANFDFFGRTMQGRKEDHPRWKRATSQVESVFGEALGKIYCERHFPAASKERMEKLVRNLQVALSERIDAQGKKTLQQIGNGAKLKVGDVVVSRMTITLDRAMDFVQLKDRPAACFEPVAQLSGYRWNGVGYYMEVEDAATNYFFDMLGKGMHVLEVRYRVQRTGTYQVGASTVQSAYAPEFASHSSGITIIIDD